MANRIVLNETSYHGAGAISAIVEEAKARDTAKPSSAPIPISLNLVLRER